LISIGFKCSNQSEVPFKTKAPEIKSGGFFYFMDVADAADAVASADVVARCDARNDGDNYLDDDNRHDEQSGGPADAVA
jgi:hypothetical protein